ncbi:MAG TPA: sigma 54-interacting transcriptional regulator [Polyangiaceae bacterium]|nr:sigma 54-interacting transcriptional regulator [Polyangiaceae bacterium]
MSEAPSANPHPSGSAGSASEASYQLVVFSGEELRIYELPREGAVSIGRAEGNVVRLDDPSVSRHHALLHLGPRLVLEDLGGKNATSLPDRARAGDMIETHGVPRLARERAEVAVGERLIFGVVGTVLRRAPAPEIPLLVGQESQNGPVVQSPTMAALYEQAARAARSNISVLLRGETGAGKDVLARAIHAHSRRADAPFMSINCAALTESLLETELFGCEKGAFTGALSARAGLFEAASPGTVFLDEVAELSPATQAKLLRVLEERTVTRVGSTKGRPIDVRFIAATNRDLEAALQREAFRSDLYFRLNGITLAIPPLRERREEIAALVRRFLAAAQRELERARPLTISEQALEVLVNHDWPGNVRELRNTIERISVLCPTDTILLEHLPAALLSRPSRPAPAPFPVVGPPSLDQAKAAVTARYRDELRETERARIAEALLRCSGNQTRAAELLGMSRRTLVTRLGELGMDRPRKRDKT